MHVTLLEDVASLGPKGLTVEVPEGYAMNFLFPQFLAVKTTEPTTKAEPDVAPSKAELAEQSLAQEADGLDVVVQAQVSKGKMKPVTATEIRAGLKELGVMVPKSVIRTKPLADPGTYDVNLEFPSGFEAKISVTIEPTA